MPVAWLVVIWSESIAMYGSLTSFYYSLTHYSMCVCRCVSVCYYFWTQFEFLSVYIQFNVITNDREFIYLFEVVVDCGSWIADCIWVYSMSGCRYCTYSLTDTHPVVHGITNLWCLLLWLYRLNANWTCPQCMTITVSPHTFSCRIRNS